MSDHAPVDFVTFGSVRLPIYYSPLQKEVKATAGPRDPKKSDHRQSALKSFSKLMIPMLRRGMKAIRSAGDDVAPPATDSDSPKEQLIDPHDIYWIFAVWRHLPSAFAQWVHAAQKKTLTSQEPPPQLIRVCSSVGTYWRKFRKARR